jgi:hypothetical protein
MQRSRARLTRTSHCPVERVEPGKHKGSASRQIWDPRYPRKVSNLDCALKARGGHTPARATVVMVCCATITQDRDAEMFGN